MSSAVVDNLSPKQEQGIVALLSEPTMAKAAAAIGVAQKTIHRWLDDPNFLAAYRKARREAFAHAISMTHQYAPVAVQVLVKISVNEAAPFAARVSAAATLLKFSRESLELDDLAARVEVVERGIGQSGMSTIHQWQPQSDLSAAEPLVPAP